MAKPFEVKFDMKPFKKVVDELGFGEMGAVQKYATHRIKHYMDRRTPRRNQDLIDDAIVGYKDILYDKPYAAPMYRGYFVSRETVPFKYTDAPQRGKEWDIKTASSYGPLIVRDVQRFHDNYNK